MESSIVRTGTAPPFLSRRQFLKLSGLGLAVSRLDQAVSASPASGDRAVILLLLVGGPSQHESFDPKPDAPAEIRGPFRSIATCLPGIRVTEYLPRLARRLDRVTMIRSVFHDAAPIHETGFQLLQTGGLFQTGVEHPHVGALASRILGPQGSSPPFVIVPGPLGSTGVAISNGQSAGLPSLDEESVYRPIREADRTAEPDHARDRYGRTEFGSACLLARRLVESGTRFVTVNMYQSVFQTPSWDCHGFGPFSTFDDYQNIVLPSFDLAYSALLDDLERTGRLASTLVVAVGEFGRTPRVNASGGRDHWPGVFTALLAGGGTPGGLVIGSSDAQGAEPVDDPFPLAHLATTIARALRIDLNS